MTVMALIQRDWIARGMIVVLNSLCIAAIFAFYDPVKFRFAWRYAGFVVFFIYLVYFIAMLIIDTGNTKYDLTNPKVTVWHALNGLLVYGIPGLVISVCGTLPGWIRKQENESASVIYDDYSEEIMERSDKMNEDNSASDDNCQTMKTHLEFKTGKFLPYEGEEDQINPGVWGKRLAEYLEKHLGAMGIETEEMNPEDWGWRLPIKNKEFSLWIGCGHQDGDDETFLCFIVPDKPVIRRWFRKIDTSVQVGRAAEALEKILTSDPDIRKFRWWGKREMMLMGK